MHADCAWAGRRRPQSARLEEATPPPPWPVPWASASAAPTASARLGPLRVLVGPQGLSASALGWPHAPRILSLGRGGGLRTTHGLPGTGLSWSLEHTVVESAASSGRLLRELQRLRWLRRKDAPGPRLDALPAVIATAEAMAVCLGAARSQVEAKRRAGRCREAVRQASRQASRQATGCGALVAGPAASEGL